MLKIVDSSAITNLARFGASREISGRQFHQTARYAMRLWVSFALKLQRGRACEGAEIRRPWSGTNTRAIASTGPRL